MKKFYITFTKTTSHYSWDLEKTIWNTIDNCLVIIEADIEEEASDKLYKDQIKNIGDKITNIKISTVNPVF